MYQPSPLKKKTTISKNLAKYSKIVITTYGLGDIHVNTILRDSQ